MKNVTKLFGIIVLMAVIGFTMASCGGGSGDLTGDPIGSGDPPDLPGTITISPSTGVITGTELIATYGGSEAVNYQWKKGAANVGTNSNTFTPSTEGSYTVTISAAGYKSKTSDAVIVSDPEIIYYSANANNLTPPTGTTAIDFFFTAAVTGLTSSDITVTNGTGSVTKGILTGSGTDWSLGITVSATGNITVNIDKSGIYNGIITVAVKQPGPVWEYVKKIPNFAGFVSTIAWVNDKFIIGTSNGKMTYSSDGINWTALYDTLFDSSIKAFAYGNNTYVAVGYGGKILYSLNGTTWSAVADSKFGSSGICAIAYGNSTFVAVGVLGKMAYSSDGINWSAVADSKFGSSYINSITYGNGAFVAVGNDNKMAVSSDGINWSAVADSTYNLSKINAIAYGNGAFVAVGSDNKIAVSTDNGVTWTAVTDSTYNLSDIYLNAGTRRITWGNNKFVFRFADKITTVYSSNGISWTVIEGCPFDTADMVFGNGKFVAMANNREIWQLVEN